GVAPMTMSPFAAWLITQMDWRAAQLVIAVLVWATLVPAALFVRRPPPAPAAEPGAAAEGPRTSLRDAFFSAPFVVLALTFFASRLGECYAVAATFGCAYGGVMPLYAVLAREYFGQRILGAVFGAAAMVSSLGMALGPAVGGWIFDTFGRYTWMYVGSAAIGLGAVAIALAFPPFPRAARGVSPAAA